MMADCPTLSSVPPNTHFPNPGSGLIVGLAAQQATVRGGWHGRHHLVEVNSTTAHHATCRGLCHRNSKIRGCISAGVAQCCKQHQHDWERRPAWHLARFWRMNKAMMAMIGKELVWKTPKLHGAEEKPSEFSWREPCQTGESQHCLTKFAD